MHGPDLHLRRDTALAGPAARRPGRGLLGASVGIALASCTLAQQDFQTWLEDGGEFAFLNFTFLVVVAFFHAERMAWRSTATAELEAKLV